MSKLLEKQLRCLETKASCDFGRQIKLLGEGAFGYVIQGTHTHNGKRTVVAVKLAKARASQGIDAHAAIKNECLQLRKVSPPEQPHPHIVTLFLAGIMQDPTSSLETNAIIMELCTEGCLYDFTLRRSYPMSRLQILYEICNGLAYMHRRGVYHRDLKPENILIQRIRNPPGHGSPHYGFACKIADFGLATDKLFCQEASGTIPYLAPEMISGPPPYNTAKGDIFAVGVILLEMLLSEIPWLIHEDKVSFVVERKWIKPNLFVFDDFFGKSLAYYPNKRAGAEELQEMALDLWQRFGHKGGSRF